MTANKDNLTHRNEPAMKRRLQFCHFSSLRLLVGSYERLRFHSGYKLFQADLFIPDCQMRWLVAHSEGIADA